MKYLIWGLVGLLVLLHQDYWQWGNDTLVFGFLPYTMAYHGCLSLAAAFVWYLATRFCWPARLNTIRPEAVERQQDEVRP